MAYSKERYHSYTKHWMASNKKRLQAYRKNGDLKKKYGITLEDYNFLLVRQNGVCAICHLPETQLNPRSSLPYNLAVDHDHNSGKVRELLCSSCNRTLGMVNDNVNLLKAMIKYVEKHSMTLKEITMNDIDLETSAEFNHAG